MSAKNAKKMDVSSFDLNEPIPPEIVEQFPEFVRPYIDAGRKMYLEITDLHRADHGHDLWESFPCLLHTIGVVVDRFANPDRSAEDRLTDYACVRLMIGSGMMLAIEAQQSRVRMRAIPITEETLAALEKALGIPGIPPESMLGSPNDEPQRQTDQPGEPATPPG